SVWNLRERIAASVQADSITAILRIIAEVLSVDAGQYILQMKEVGTKQLSAATVEHESEEATAILDPSVSEEDEMMDGFSKQKKITDISDLIPAANYEIRQATSLLVAQKTALEMVVNMCCSDDPSDDEWEELSSSDESDLGLEKSLNDGGGQLLSPLCLSDEVHTALLNHFIPKK
ncbi:hypothetical protein XELAEV_180224544mg, partial [Xenopus laevis]